MRLTLHYVLTQRKHEGGLSVSQFPREEESIKSLHYLRLLSLRFKVTKSGNQAAKS